MIREHTLQEEWKVKKKEHVICGVVPGSIAEEMEIEPGDMLLQIDDMEI